MTLLHYYRGKLRPWQKIHRLKTLPQYFQAVRARIKPFEVRRFDRDFAVNDILVLEEWSEETGYTGRAEIVTISYMLYDTQYCKPGYVILGLKFNT